MKIKDHLPEKQKQQIENMKSPKKKKRKKKKENLSFKDWQDIMGINRDVYTRRNGAVRRK